MARRTIKDCQQEIDALKSQLVQTSVEEVATLKRNVGILSDEIVKRNQYILDVEQELAKTRVEMDQHSDELPGYVLVQARMRLETVAVIGKLQEQLGAHNHTDVLARGISLLEKSQIPFKDRVFNKVKSLLHLSLIGIGLMGCASTQSARTISYPWQCEQQNSKQCTLLGYVVSTDNSHVAKMYGDALCDEAPKSITANPHRHEFLIVCK